MTYSPEAFRKYCHDAAKHFLQTAVVIDNEAVFDMDRLIREAQAKQAEAEVEAVAQQDKIVIPSGKLIEIKLEVPAAAKPEVVAKEVTPPKAAPTLPSFSHLLDAKLLIDGFSDSRIVCSVICPGKDEAQAVERAIKVAITADIIVVDWMLDKAKGEAGSKRARDIIKGVIENDIESRGRLRLIAVYTAEDSPVSVLDQLFDHIKGMDFRHDKISKDEKTRSIRNSHLKISVISKPSVKEQAGIQPIPFAELPGKLLDLFCDLNFGLLPSVALHSIAAIREETHHLLAVLHGKLDPALIGHRCLLLHPEDAEEFCDDLISGELRSILSMKQIGSGFADKMANKRWIGSKIKPDAPHKYKSFNLTREQAFSLVENGEKAIPKVLSEIKADWLRHKLEDKPDHKDADGQAIEIEKAIERILSEGASAAKFYKVPDELSEKTIPQLLDGSEATGEQINLDFSRLCSLKRETFGLRTPVEGWTPRLTLGTILQLRDGAKDTFLICLQPRCDSVRLEKDKVWKFPFLVLEEMKGKLNVVIKAFDKDFEPVDKKLFYEPKPRNQIVFEFKSVTGDAIISTNDSGVFKFKNEDIIAEKVKEFWWVADLKDFVAQKIADEMSTRVGTVGFDEYEWLRRKAR
ncbi:MAG: response regulator receiver domain [Pseudomonadota bacterium]